MGRIDANTSLEELAVVVSGALEKAGITATLSGGASVTLYSENEYQSFDLDFVSSARIGALADALEALGFHRIVGARQFEHDESPYYVEFPPGPLAFGETVVADSDATTLQTSFGPVRIVTPTQVVMDRLAAYVHWHDRQSLDQATMVARRQDVDWPSLSRWARVEHVDPAIITRLRERAGEQRGT